jgi:ribonuclease J
MPFAAASSGSGCFSRQPRSRSGLDPVHAYTQLVSETLRIIPLGGLGEVGKNMTVYETGGELLVVDAGLAFPRDEHLGVDLLLPDVGYLEGRRVRAVVLTHGHEDHVGGLPYLLRKIEVETIVATRLTLGLIKSKLDEHGLAQAAELVEADPEGAPLELGPFRVELVRVAHSIPDSVALVVETGAGRVLHTGDWKLDHTPVDGLKTDVGKLAEVGNRGVDLLLGDSTNAERPGSTGSERLVGEAFRTLFPLRRGRILVASFASNIHRMQQAADVAVECGRKITVIGRSMRKNLNIARNLGYVDIPEGEIVSPGEAAQLEPHQVLALCTGSQGEPMSALTRIAYGDHPALTVEPGDTVIISAKPVPGNELRVHDSINQLARAGAEVLHEEIAPVHVSGHACQEELRTMLSLLRPRYVMPIHGEYRMLAAHAKLAREAGVPDDRIILADNGSVVELARGGARLVGQVDAGVTFVDGLRVGDVQDVALRDRRRLADDGVLIVVTTLASSDGGEIAPPELIARGFAESDELLAELRTEADRVVRELATQRVTEIKLLQEHIHDAIGQVVYDRTRRRPMVLPVVIEV